MQRKVAWIHPENAKAGRNYRFPVPRPETYLGKLAGSGRSATFCFAGDGQMGKY